MLLTLVIYNKVCECFLPPLSKCGKMSFSSYFMACVHGTVYINTFVMCSVGNRAKMVL